MIIQTMMEIKKVHEIHNLEILMEKIIKEESHRDEISGKQSDYINPAALRLGVLRTQRTIPRKEPASYCPV